MILTGQSLEIMRGLDDNSVDCVITDPPYAGFAGMETNESYCEWFAAHYSEMLRVCRREERICASQPQGRINLFAQRFGFQSVIKLDNAMQDKRGDDAYFLCKTKTIPQLPTDIEQWPSDLVPKSSHPNDRDVGKMQVVVEALSSPDEIVLDPFCGSAAIGVACVLLGRQYIGVELIPDRAEDAAKRLEAAAAVKDTMP